MGPGEKDFEDFYSASRDGCLRAVLASVGDLGTAKELIDEAYARAWASWRKVRAHPAPEAWVVRTALNAGVSAWRSRRRERLLAAGEEIAATSWYAGADADLARADVMAVLRRLPTRQRQVVALRIFMDMDTAEAAAALGIAPGTATAHLARAMATLRAELTSSGRREV